jgi:hypothetical protein
MSEVLPDEERLSPEFKAKWLAALRSGKYEQGRGFLRSENDCYCCLGVALDLCGVVWKADSWRDGRYGTAEHGSWAYPIAPERKTLGLTLDQAHELASLNDMGKSFAEIADYIEKNL